MGAQNATNNNTQLHDIVYVPEDNNDGSPLDGLGEHIRLNAKKEDMGGSEVVEITFDSDAVENGSESIAVWTGTVGRITRREPKNTFGNDAEDKGTLEHKGDK